MIQLKTTNYVRPVFLILCSTCLALWLTSFDALRAAVVDFEDVGISLADDSFYNGGPDSNSDGWTSGGVFFENTFTDFGTFAAWEGWAYSNIQDITTAGFGNQYAAYSASGSTAGFGVGNSRTYALGFTGSTKDANGTVINFTQDTLPNFVHVTNTTYTLFAIRDGNDAGANFAQQFQDGDFLRLSITGFTGTDGTGSSTGQVDFDLANYGGAGSQDDIVITDWTQIDLSSLQASRSLQFSLDSNVVDVFSGQQFLNPPSYFALDDLSIVAVPEPTSFGLLTLIGVGVVACVGRRGRAN